MVDRKCAFAFRPILAVLMIGVLVALAPLAAVAEEAVKIGSAYALLNRAQSPKASVILIPGGDGVMGIQPDGTFSSLRGNQLVRTRKGYLAHGVATLTIDRGVAVPAAIAYMRTIAAPVIVVATSRGSLRVPGALAAKPDGLVLTASFLGEVRSHIGSPDRLPRTLIVHHKQDGCRHTSPSGVQHFKAWGGAKVAVEWMEGGTNIGDPCQAKGYHGFNGLDARVVATVAQFATATGKP
jgi:hypothetical protein